MGGDSLLVGYRAGSFARAGRRSGLVGFLRLRGRSRPTVGLGDVLLQNCTLDAPLSAASYLDGRQLARTDHGTCLGHRDVQDLGDVDQREKALRDHERNPFDEKSCGSESIAEVVYISGRAVRQVAGCGRGAARRPDSGRARTGAVLGT